MPYLPRNSLILALLASLLLHAVVLAGWLPAWRWRLPPPPEVTRMEVQLVTTPPPDAELLRKNTLEETKDEAKEQPSPEPPPVEAPPPRPKPVLPPPRAQQAPTWPREAQKPAIPAAETAKAAQSAPRNPNDYLIYPQAAKDAGLEGSGVLLLSLDPDGTVTGAEVAAGSGHEILDAAAIKAVLRAGRVAAGGRTSITWPYTFRLR